MTAYRAIQRIWARDYLIPWLVMLPKRVLDLGCGDGGVAMWFAENGSDVDAQDVGTFD